MIMLGVNLPVVEIVIILQLITVVWLWRVISR